jgi:hypothetical protein
VYEGVASIRSLKGITNGADLFLRRREPLSPSKLRCELLPSVTTDGDRNINGSLTGVGRICEEVTHVNSEKPRVF